MVSRFQEKTTYPTPAHYVATCEARASAGRWISIPQANTTEELHALAIARPDLARYVWPAPESCEALGLKANPEDYTAELHEDDKAKFLYSLAKDAEFRKAVAAWLKEAV